MTFSKIFFASSMVLSASFTTACSASKAETAVQTNASDYQKPGASVSYSHNLKSQVSVGEAVTFTLRLSESYNQGQLIANLGSEGGIALFPSSTQASFDMSTGSGHKMDVFFTANSSGRHYINVQAQAIEASGQAQPRIFSIPVQVGPATAQKPNPNMKTLDNGQNVIEMEAEEEIIVK